MQYSASTYISEMWIRKLWILNQITTNTWSVDSWATLCPSVKFPQNPFITCSDTLKLSVHALSPSGKESCRMIQNPQKNLGRITTEIQSVPPWTMTRPFTISEHNPSLAFWLIQPSNSIKINRQMYWPCHVVLAFSMEEILFCVSLHVCVCLSVCLCMCVKKVRVCIALYG